MTDKLCIKYDLSVVINCSDNDQKKYLKFVEVEMGKRREEDEGGKEVIHKIRLPRNPEEQYLAKVIEYDSQR